MTSIAILWAMPPHWPEIFTHDDDDHQEDVMKRDTTLYWMDDPPGEAKEAGGLRVCCSLSQLCLNMLFYF